MKGRTWTAPTDGVLFISDIMSPFASFRLNSSCPEWLSRALAAQLLSRAELRYDSAVLFRHVGLCEPNPSSCLTNKQQIMLMAFTVMPSRAEGHMWSLDFCGFLQRAGLGSSVPTEPPPWGMISAGSCYLQVTLAMATLQSWWYYHRFLCAGLFAVVFILARKTTGILCITEKQNYLKYTEIYIPEKAKQSDVCWWSPGSPGG